MKNLLKSTVAMPFKFLKGMLDMMKEILSSILKLFGHPGLKTGGAHSAKVEKTEDSLKKDELSEKNDLVDKPSLEQARKMVNDDVLKKIKKIVSTKERDPADMATLSKTMKIYVSGLSADKMTALAKMTDDQMRLKISDDLLELKQRQTQIIKQEKVKTASVEDNNEPAKNDKQAKLKRRIQQSKMNAAPKPKMAFAM